MPKKTFPALVNHHDCETLTTLTVENAPRDGSLGRNRRYRKGANSITSCAIITTAANELVNHLHDRMPAILQPESYDVWLDPETDLTVLKKLLSPFPSSKMKSHPVSSAVNYPENNSVELIVPVDAELGTTPSLF